MKSRGTLTASHLLAACALAGTVLAGCKKAEPPPAQPAQPPVAQKTAPAVSKEQATEALLALPEVQAWSAEIAQRSHGRVKGAILEDAPAPRTINGRAYWQLSFVENGKDAVHRRASFLVAQSGGEILVEDVENGTLLSLDDWRRGIRKVETKSLN